MYKIELTKFMTYCIAIHLKYHDILIYQYILYITSIMDPGNSHYAVLPNPSLSLLSPDVMAPHIAGFDVRGPSGSHSTIKTAVNML